MSSVPRGLRNNNPGNIRETDIKYLGEIDGVGQDPAFEEFISIEYGYRAIFVLLRSYIKNGFNTIDKIINRYAPSFENDTSAYISDVVNRTGIDAGTVISAADMDSLELIVAAISAHENGREPDMSKVRAGRELVGPSLGKKKVGSSASPCY